MCVCAFDTPVCVCPPAPLQDLSALSYTSIVGVLGTMYTAAVMAIRYFDRRWFVIGSFVATGGVVCDWSDRTVIWIGSFVASGVFSCDWFLALFFFFFFVFEGTMCTRPFYRDNYTAVRVVTAIYHVPFRNRGLDQRYVPHSVVNRFRTIIKDTAPLLTPCIVPYHIPLCSTTFSAVNTRPTPFPTAYGIVVSSFLPRLWPF